MDGAGRAISHTRYVRPQIKNQILSELEKSHGQRWAGSSGM